jgi:hypothetical protein
MYKNGLLASNQLCPFFHILATPTLVLILLWSGALFCAWLQRVCTQNWRFTKKACWRLTNFVHFFQSGEDIYGIWC